jgi:predicted nuclease with TOPRIM domain|tara:strand:- start:2 stop:400 length:399 start_codon:yes stop_codon:yes gene_type:complete
MNLSVVLGGLLIVTIASTAWYIDYQADQISTLKGNQIVLETQIEEQNASIERYLQQQKAQEEQLNVLEEERRKAMQDVNKLRKTFANLDLDQEALADPVDLQNRINKGSLRVLTTLEKLTNPNQFDEKSNSN